ncbi:MAG: nitroreductase family protein, partial [Anaerolineae bacterium]|nr:nitroreductase family protein [Anaerolineae bacterium]
SRTRAGKSKNQDVIETPASDSLNPDAEGILSDPARRLEFKLKQPGIRRLSVGYDSLEFQPPVIDKAAYLTRQSYRQFLGEPVPFTALGQVLACLMPHHFPGSPLPKYRYPSAGNLYPVQVYLYLKPERVAGAAGGFYYYHPLEHRLILLSTETNLEDEVHAVINREIFEQSAFSLFLVADLAAIEPMYGSLARDFCLLEAGYMSQILMEVAPSQAIGLCPIGDLTFTGLQARFELTEHHLLLHSLVGGGISPEQRQTLPQPEAANQTALSEAAIKAYLAQTLPAYMIPATYVFLDHLPLTPNGKVDRKALPEPEIHLTEQDFVLPQTEIEQTLARIVQTTLQIDEVGLHHNFFDLGADSLGLVHIQGELQTTFEQDIPLTTMFNHPTISSLAAYLGAASDQKIATTPDQSPSERTAAMKAVRQRRERQRHNREKIR